MANDGYHVDILVVADDGDPHFQAVEARLQEFDVHTARFNQSDLAETRLRSRRGSLQMASDGPWQTVDRDTSIWWFRAGHPHIDADLEDDEARLIADEGPHVLIGAIRAAQSRLVDDPDVVRRAEWKLHQLTMASALAISTPPWTVTDSLDVVRQFAQGRRLIVKALSPGTGIAPFVSPVFPEDLREPIGFPSLFQEEIAATADLRVVTVNGAVEVWRRPREPDTTDWRSIDPHGLAFSRLGEHALGTEPVRLTSALGLTMSVQDWLETDQGPVFLEANPQGAWAFLDGAITTIAPIVASHLVRSDRDNQGEWPEPRKRALYDFLTKARAPENDGVIAPTYEPPVWADAVSAIPGAVDVAKAARVSAEDSANVAEEKASRLVQLTLALLTLCLAVGSYQLTFALERSRPWLILMGPVAIALVCLTIAAFEGVLIDRVGFYHSPSGADLADIGRHTPASTLIVAEDRGRRLARWSANNKHTDLMQARAWFTRGLAALLLAGIVAGACRAGASASVPNAQASNAAASSSVIPNHESD